MTFTVTRRPRIPDHVVARYPATTRPPAPHTERELLRLLSMLDHDDVTTVAVGHGRNASSVAAAAAFTDAAAATGLAVAAVVHWPATAASWLRPARRLTSAGAEAIVLADTPAGCAQLTARLAERPGWSPAHTYGFASVADADLLSLTAPGTLAGMTGPTSTGGTWRIDHEPLIHYHA
jgi:hypothetical protein